MASDDAAQLDLVFALGADGRSRLAKRRVGYPWALTRPFWIDRAPAGMASLIPQSATSILLAEDRFRQRIAVKAGAAAHVASQGAQAVHRGKAEAAASSRWQLSCAAGGLLEVLNDPPILFPQANLRQEIEIDLAADATLLLAEGVTWHPDPAAPSFHGCETCLTVRRPEGQLLLHERGQITPTALARAGRPHLAALAQVWVLTAPRPGLEAALRQVLAGEPQAYGGVTTLPHDAGLLLRAACLQSGALRRLQEAAWRATRTLLYGKKPPSRRRGL
ncbi:MAG: hypothetical protein Kilf2KO_39850 [Rhodospirillales bacterium]